MTKKLAELFDLADMPADATAETNEAFQTIQDNKDIMAKVDDAIDKIDLALPTLLGHAITAKTAKMDKKLRMVALQLQKARLDHQMSKDDPGSSAIDGQGILLDRNALLEQILQKNKNT